MTHKLIPLNIIAKARNAIETREQVCFDVCTEHGQLFGNVRDTAWFLSTICKRMIEDEECSSI